MGWRARGRRLGGSGLRGRGSRCQLLEKVERLTLDSFERCVWKKGESILRFLGKGGWETQVDEWVGRCTQGRFGHDKFPYCIQFHILSFNCAEVTVRSRPASKIHRSSKFSHHKYHIYSPTSITPSIPRLHPKLPLRSVPSRFRSICNNPNEHPQMVSCKKLFSCPEKREETPSKNRI